MFVGGFHPAGPRGGGMRRREFITLLGGAAVAWPLAVGAQQTADKVHRIGLLSSVTAAGYARQLEALRQGLRELGYIEGKNLVIEYRWAEGKYDRLAELAAELVRLKVNLIVTHGTPGSRAAKQATTTIPIVIAVSGDAVATGLVQSVARPGGNITGATFFFPELNAKRLEILKEGVPHISRVGVLLNPSNPATLLAFKAMEVAAASLNLELHRFEVRGPDEFASAFSAMVERRVEAVEIIDDPMLIANAPWIADFAMRSRLPAIGFKEFVEGGGLMAYAVDFPAIWRRAAIFIDKILKGANPADLPVEQATKFELIVNLKTAKALGITIPPAILLRVDEVIE
jgi:putative tryptophan/tyrosine transport system substrate-binding protein